MTLCSKFFHLKLLDLMLKQAVSIDVFHQPEVTLFVALVFKHFNDSLETNTFFLLLFGDKTTHLTLVVFILVFLRSLGFK